MSAAPDRAVAGAFLALGAALLASSFALPEGVGRVPGPGFFPRVIGAATLALAVALLWRSRGPGPERKPEAPGADLRATLGTVALLALYLLSWGSGLFALRTAVFAAVLLRFLGQPWRAALAVAVPLGLAVFFAFGALGVALR